MTNTIYLAPHDAMPDGPDRTIVVLRRFDEDDPDKVSVQIILSGHPEEVTHPHRPDGTLMHFDEAIAAARIVAEQEGIGTVHVLDRLQGPRERQVLRHHGDHAAGVAPLADDDLEDGVIGSDMRDITHR
jgi:hypothetical protein